MPFHRSASSGAVALLLAIATVQTTEAINTKILRELQKADSRWHVCPIDGSKDWWACWWHSNTHVCGENRESCCCNGGYAYVDEACVWDKELSMQPCPGDPKPEAPDCSKCSDCCRSHWTESDHHYEPSYHTQPVARRPAPSPPPPSPGPPPKKKINKDPVEIPIEQPEEKEEEEVKTTTTTTEPEGTWNPPTTTAEEVPVSGEPSTPKPPVKLTPEEIEEKHP